MKKWICIIIILSSIIISTACKIKGHMEEYSRMSFDYFDTITTVVCYANSKEQGEQYLTLAYEELERYHKLFDAYHTYEGIENICSLNTKAGKKAVVVDTDLFTLLKLGKEAGEKTCGEVNIAFGTVLSIWHDYRCQYELDTDHAILPPKKLLEKANQHTDLNKLILDEKKNTVFYADQELQLDVGAVAKGYVGEKIADVLREAGVTSATISIGGNVTVIGEKPNHDSFIIGINDPKDQTSDILCKVAMNGGSVITSGGSERYYEVDGKKYHHIINKDTLFPTDTYQLVTVLIKDSYLGDAYSTAFFNMELQSALDFCNKTEQLEAMWVLKDGTPVYSDGFREYLIQ